MNGYAECHPVVIEVRADMLESVAGLDEQGMKRELVFARAALDLSDPGSMRWLAALLARKISEVKEA